MIKFSLTIWVCSFLTVQSVCAPPIHSVKLYDSWYECTKAAHHESVKVLSKLGYKLVNDNHLATRYSCKAQKTI